MSFRIENKYRVNLNKISLLYDWIKKKAIIKEKTKTRFLFRLNNDDNNNNIRATKAKRTSWRAFARGTPGTP